MALQLTPRLLVKAIKKLGLEKEVVILVATSGDTGKAALQRYNRSNIFLKSTGQYPDKIFLPSLQFLLRSGQESIRAQTMDIVLEDELQQNGMI